MRIYLPDLFCCPNKDPPVPPNALDGAAGAGVENKELPVPAPDPNRPPPVAVVVLGAPKLNPEQKEENITHFVTYIIYF